MLKASLSNFRLAIGIYIENFYKRKKYGDSTFGIIEKMILPSFVKPIYSLASYLGSHR